MARTFRCSCCLHHKGERPIRGSSSHRRQSSVAYPSKCQRQRVGTAILVASCMFRRSELGIITVGGVRSAMRSSKFPGCEA